MSLPALHALLDDGARFDAEFGERLSNHLPMALAALQRLGADAARMSAFAAGYAARLHAMPPIGAWPAGDPWRGRLGEPAAWPAYRGLFHLWLLHEGPADVLSQALPTLMRGCGAAAFHGLIRTAHAVDAGHAGELADALAYWAARWFALADPVGVARTDDPAVALKALRAPLPRQPLIAERMAQVGAHPSFARAAGALQVDLQHSLPRLARFAAERYAASADFTVLHLVTSAHAMRVLLPWLDDDDRLPALRCFAGACLAGAATTRPQALPRPALLPWRTIVQRALASDNDHVIKLVDSCLEHGKALKAGPWQAAATRAVVPVGA